jgi:hypothetical protein
MNVAVVTSSNDSVVDPNLNTISISGGALTDTLGVTAVTITGSPSSGTVTYSYPVTSSTTGPGCSSSKCEVIVTFTNETLKTSFGCHGVTDFPAASGYYFPTQVTLPDGSKYLFTYEANGSDTTGRLASITYPTGEEVTYAYSGVRCYDGTPDALTKVVANDTTYTYTRNSGTWTTDTVVSNTTGDANTTVYTFAHSRPN